MNLDELPSFSVFCDLVQHRIGFMPSYLWHDVGLSGHRVRVFENPPGAEIRLSKMALARYIRISDIFSGALQRNSTNFLHDCLCIEAGSYELLSNRLPGLALVARGFKRVLITRIPAVTSLENLLKSAQREVFPLISLLLPLAHQIGHVPEAQALCPKATMEDVFLETLRINYERVAEFSGKFDYSTSLSDPTSPVNLAALRQEVAAEYFATCALCVLVAKTLSPGEAYPIRTVAAGILMFPIAMAFEALCLGKPLNIRILQDITLAMECRYSVLVDGVRGSIKSIFKTQPDRQEVFQIIDDEIDDVHLQLYNLQQLIWPAMTAYSEFLSEAAEWNVDKVLKYAREATPDIRQQLAIAEYISVLLNEVDSPHLFEENEGFLKGRSDAASDI